MFSVDHPFFLPLWRRIVLVVLVFAWTIFEIRMGSYFWAALFVAIGLWCSYSFFRGDYVERVEAARKK